DVAAVGVPDEHERFARSLDTGDHRREIVDLALDVERPGMRARSPVATPVVAGHPELVVEPPAELEHAGRAIERPVDQDDVGATGPSGGRRPDGHFTWTIRSTSAAVDASLVAEPASTTTVSPWATRSCSTAVSTANQTISSVDPYVATSTGSTPHDKVSALTVLGFGDNATSGRAGRNRAIALAVRPVFVQHRIAPASTSSA